MQISEEWLESLNQQMGEQGIPYAQRPFKAIETWTLQNNCSVIFSSPTANRVFLWFQEHSPKGAHAIGSMFTGAFYFDAYFWKVSIPIAYGTVKINALDCIEEIPKNVRDRLESSRPHVVDFCALWVDLLDYAYGFDDIRRSVKMPDFAHRLLTSGDNELRATVRLLTESPRRQNPKAIESARMAAEMFLKAYLAAHAGLSEKEAKVRLGHNLTRALDECRAISKNDEFEQVKQNIGLFPDVEMRYSGAESDPISLWNGYCIAQYFGVTLVRSLTDRDSRSQMFPPRKPESPA